MSAPPPRQPAAQERPRSGTACRRPRPARARGATRRARCRCRRARRHPESRRAPRAAEIGQRRAFAHDEHGVGELAKHGELSLDDPRAPDTERALSSAADAGARGRRRESRRRAGLRRSRRCARARQVRLRSVTRSHDMKGRGARPPCVVANLSRRSAREGGGGPGVSEPRIGRVLVASLHQAIADLLPTRLEFYENWLNVAGSARRHDRPRAAVGGPELPAARKVTRTHWSRRGPASTRRIGR